jgi:hypothetical protein
MPQGIDLGIVLQINPQKIQTIFLIQHPRTFKNIGFIFATFAQNGGIALWLVIMLSILYSLYEK